MTITHASTFGVDFHDAFEAPPSQRAFA